MISICVHMGDLSLPLSLAHLLICMRVHRHTHAHNHNHNHTIKQTNKQTHTHSMATFGGDNIYVCAGRTDLSSATPNNAVHIYSIKTGSWTRLNDFPGTPRADPAGATSNQHINMMGGMYWRTIVYNPQTWLSEVLRYTPATGTLE